MSVAVAEKLDLAGSLRGVERPFYLPGVTAEIKDVPTPGGGTENVYITINDLDGQVFELFINSRDSSVQELLSISMVQISRMLRYDIPLETIIEDLVKVHSANTGHMIPGGFCPSLAARIGIVLGDYLKEGGRVSLVKKKNVGSIQEE